MQHHKRLRDHVAEPRFATRRKGFGRHLALEIIQQSANQQRGNNQIQGLAYFLICILLNALFNPEFSSKYKI